MLDTIERHSDHGVVLTAAYVLLCSLAMRSATRKKLVAANAIKATVGTIGSYRAEESVLLPACELLTKLTTSKSEKRAAGDAEPFLRSCARWKSTGCAHRSKSTTPLVLGDGADTPTISADNLGQFMNHSPSHVRRSENRRPDQGAGYRARAGASVAGGQPVGTGASRSRLPSSRAAEKERRASEHNLHSSRAR